MTFVNAARFAVIVTAATALSALLAGCGQGQQQSGGPPPPTVTVANPIQRTVVDQDDELVYVPDQPDFVFSTGVLQFSTFICRAAILPDNRVVDRNAGPPVPQQRRLTLVGNPDGRHR